MKSLPVKYPRTPHLPFSPGCTSDDKMLRSCDHFNNKEVVITEKMDGENCTLYSDYLHARSTNEKNHTSRNWLKQFHATIRGNIPTNQRLVVENMYAKHAIHYKHLKSYVYGLSVWQDDICLNWDHTVNIFTGFGIPVPTVIYRGVWNLETCSKLYTPQLGKDECEGFVVRVASHFAYSEFSLNVAKYVRANHVGSNTRNWMYSSVIPNLLDN